MTILTRKDRLICMGAMLGGVVAEMAKVRADHAHIGAPHDKLDVALCVAEVAAMEARRVVKELLGEVT